MHSGRAKTTLFFLSGTDNAVALAVESPPDEPVLVRLLLRLPDVKEALEAGEPLASLLPSVANPPLLPSGSGELRFKTDASAVRCTRGAVTSELPTPVAASVASARVDNLVAAG